MREEERKRVERKAERMQAARDRPQRFWSGLSTVGSVGWMVVLPTAGGALVGHLIDRRLDSGVTCGLAGLVIIARRAFSPDGGFNRQSPESSLR